MLAKCEYVQGRKRTEKQLYRSGIRSFTFSGALPLASSRRVEHSRASHGKGMYTRAYRAVPKDGIAGSCAQLRRRPGGFADHQVNLDRVLFSAASR
jgi:hypothetical protein